jgi:hypothetical protein
VTGSARIIAVSMCRAPDGIVLTQLLDHRDGSNAPEIRSREPLSARGFSAPFLRRCARTCPAHIHLHGAVFTSPGVAGPSAFSEAFASPIQRTETPLDQLPV